ncbi:hypothetical protein L7F22_059352 [Adiantum nelumboides]|nr:hypothetical protein [Adiantum nelumboides]
MTGMSQWRPALPAGHVEDGEECPNCHTISEKEENMITGDYICTSCGAVLLSHMADLRPEWHNHADEHGGDGEESHSRVGEVIKDPLRDGKCNYFELKTFISRPAGPRRGDLSDGASASRTHMDSLLTTSSRVPKDRSDRKRRQLSDHLSNVSSIAENMELAPRIATRACDLFNLGTENIRSFTHGTSDLPEALYAGCISLACAEEQTHHTLEDIATAVGLDPNEKVHKVAINKAKQGLKSYLDDLPQDSPYRVSLPKSGLTQDELERDRMVRQCGEILGMSVESIKLALEMASRAQTRKMVTRKFHSVVAAVLLMVGRLTEPRKVEFSEVVGTTKVGQDTVRKTYKEIYEKKHFLLPEEVIKKYDSQLEHLEPSRALKNATAIAKKPRHE